jgi:cytochrome P450
MREGPDTLYERLRQQYGNVVPVFLDPEGTETGTPAWLVIGYEELAEVGGNEQLFSRDSRRWRELAEGRVPASWPLLPQITWRDNTRFADTPTHQPRRDALMKALKRADQSWTRRVTVAYADQLIDRFCRLGEAELIDEYALPLPLLVLARLFGLRGPGEEARLLDAIHRMLSGGAEAQRADHEITAILRQLVRDRRVSPQQDVASWLIEAAPGLDDEAIRQDLWLMISAGAGATTHWIANAQHQLATDPRLRVGLNDGSLSVSSLLRATLWNAPPAENVMGAFARRDTVLGGRHIEAGDMIVLSLGGANHDPRLRAGPIRERYTVSNDAHVAFGTGAHRCPAPARLLGEMITTIAIERLAMRCPHMTRADPEQPLSWGPSFVVRALTALHVTFIASYPGPSRYPAPPAFGGPSWQSPSPDSPTTAPPSPVNWSSDVLSTASTLSGGTSPRRAERSSDSGRSSRWSSLIRWWRGQ